MLDLILPLVLIGAFGAYFYFFLWKSSWWAKKFDWNQDGTAPRQQFMPNDQLVAVDVSQPEPNYIFLRYNFREMDVSQSPPDPTDFFDELWIEIKDTVRDNKWMEVRTVCTPKGLRRVMLEEGYASIFAGDYLFVQRYDLDFILQQIRQQLEKATLPSQDTEPLA